MKFIAIDLSLKYLLLIIADKEKIFFSKKIDLNKDKSGALLKNLQQAMSDIHIGLENIDFIFSTIGPGNFNGIRVSLSSIRGLVLGNSIKAVGISTMECIARSIRTKKNIGVIVNAYPDHVYVQFFDNNYASLTSAELIHINDKIKIPVKNTNLILVGDRCNDFSEKIGFIGEIVTMESPSLEGLLNSAKAAITKNIFLPPDPMYLRPARATKPIHWKNKPIIR